MAVKSKAEVLTLLRKMAFLYEDTQTWLSGTFLTDVQAVESAIEAGDYQVENAAQTAAVEAVMSAAVLLSNATLELFKTSHATFGRYASSKNLASSADNLAAFNDKLFTDTESVVSRGYTKFSTMTAGGSNKGNGTVCVFGNDPNGIALDVAHSDTIRLECTKDAFSGGMIEGKEKFRVVGGDLGVKPWVEPGSSGRPYSRTYGLGLYDFGPLQDKYVLADRQEFFGCGASEATGNLIKNGDFEDAFSGSGTDKIPEWTITTDAGDITADTTTEIEGSQSLKFTAAESIYQSITNAVRTKTAYGLQIYVLGHVSSGGLTGSLTVKIKDDSATHTTLTIDLSTLVLDTATKGATNGHCFVLPVGIGANLRVEIALASIAGTGAYVIVDSIVLTQLYNWDGGYFIGYIEGTTAARRDDVWTASTTCANGGAVQRGFVNAFGMSMRHTTGGQYWTDT